jgi:inorganic triphosphatase YgiF
VESEAKLRASRRVFAALDGAAAPGGWRVTGRRDVSLRDTYWDTPDERLARAGCTLRVREQSQGAAEAGQGRAGHGPGAESELTLKGPLPDAVSANGAVWHRSELSVRAPAGSGPAEWASLPDARPVLEALAALDGPPAAGDGAGPRAPRVQPRAEASSAAGDGLLRRLRPDVVLLNPRREIVLERAGNEAVLSLDEVAVEGMPYRRRYVEVELKRGSTAALDNLVDTLQAEYALRPSRRGKVQAARAWLARQRAAPRGAAHAS